MKRRMQIGLSTLRPSSARKCAARLGALAAVAGAANAQVWVDPGADSWYDAANWNPVAVPVAGGAVVVSNGGAALLDTTASGGATATPLLSSLTVGGVGLGTGQGKVGSSGVSLLTSSLTIGSSTGSAGSFAAGVVETTAADVSVSSLVLVGSMSSQASATQVSGKLLVEGTLQLAGGAVGFNVGQLFNSLAGSTATGTVKARQISGTAGGGFLIVGNVTASTDAQVGNRSFADVVATDGGTLTLASGLSTIVGTTFGLDRTADGTRINEATGSMKLAGTLATAGNQDTLLVGRTFGGKVDGTLEVGTLAMGTDTFLNGISIGTSTADGQARGRLAAGSGDLRHLVGLSVGTTTGGTADGAINLGGALRGAGTASVGVATGNGGRLVQATGAVSAAGGAVGYNNYQIGVLSGDVAAGSSARGTLIGTGDAGSAAVSVARVGTMFNNTAAASVEGELRLGGALGLSNGFLEAGQMFLAAAGSTASGKVHVGGDLGQLAGGFLIVGNVTASTADQVGNRSFAEVTAGGGATLGTGAITIVGTTFGLDRTADGTRINEATGSMKLAGTLATAGNQDTLLVGRTFGGKVDGTLEVGTLAMGANTFQNGVSIGTSITGEAVGNVAIHGGALRTTTLAIGNSSGGTASGRLALHGADLHAGSVSAGQGTGEATIELKDSQSTVADDFDLQTGLLSLDDSLLSVGDTFGLGAGARLRLGIDGLARGTDYGAIDTLTALLAGELELDLTELVFGAPQMVFDLIIADSGISGDFGSVALFGLDGGYQATTGIFAVGNDEVYRLTLARLDVPEPASLALALLALFSLAAAGAGRRRNGRSRG